MPSPAQPIERKLAAIFAADVAGYSRLMGQDEAGTLRTLAAHREIMDRLIGEHRGRIANTAGDSVLAEFPSVVDAVQCAVEVQQALAEGNEGVPEERRMRFRIGVHVGDVMVRGADLLGDGVNVAARLQTLAAPGGVCISGEAHQYARKVLPLPYEDLGHQSVRNLEEPIRAYSLKPLGHERSGASPVRKLPLPHKAAIAVLPFENLSAREEESYLSDGISEEIITGLARFRSLFVIARHSSFAVRNDAADVQEVGRRLGASYLVHGSVRRVSERIRVSAKLIEAATGGHLWAGNYDRKLHDVFAVQDEVAQMV